jgi:hypothetical protein
LKYATALARGPELLLPGDGQRAFSLVPAIKTLDSHKKAVLSDEFGCGMALVVCAYALDAYLYMDVETALAQDLLWAHSARGRRPDYIALRPFAAVHERWVILEAKGSQSGDTYCRDFQVPDACDQLSRVHLVEENAHPSRVVTATSLFREDERHQSKVFVGDPVQNGDQSYFFRRDGIESVIRTHYLRIAALTGDARLANRLGRGRAEKVTDEGLVSIEIEGATFMGSTVGFKTSTSSIESFVGLSVSVREELLSGDFGGIAKRLGHVRPTLLLDMGGRRESWQKGNMAFERENDGTLLMVRRRGRAAKQDWE